MLFSPITSQNEPYGANDHIRHSATCCYPPRIHCNDCKTSDSDAYDGVDGSLLEDYRKGLLVWLLVWTLLRVYPAICRHSLP